MECFLREGSLSARLNQPDKSRNLNRCSLMICHFQSNNCLIIRSKVWREGASKPLQYRDVIFLTEGYLFAVLFLAKTNVCSNGNFSKKSTFVYSHTAGVLLNVVLACFLYPKQSIYILNFLNPRGFFVKLWPKKLDDP